MRNPENIDLNKYPPPPGYVVASELDVESVKHAPCDWMYWSDGMWHYCCGYYSPQAEWTYIRPSRRRTSFKRRTK